MPFYIRKAISVGPLRFNLSKSGIGVSFGVRGLRVGSGARGNYVHAGRLGVYYRKTLPGEPVATGTLFKDLAEALSSRGPPSERVGSPQHEAESLQPIESSNALQMVDSTSENLLRELNEKRKVVTAWPWFLAATCTAIYLTGLYVASAWAWIIVGLVGGLATFWRFEQDQVDRYTVLMYELEDEAKTRFQNVCAIFEELGQTGATWHVAAEEVRPKSKLEGGFTSRVTRNRISPAIGIGPANLKTNISVPRLPVGVQTLHFLPDQILVEAPEGYGAVRYSDLVVSLSRERVVEWDGPPPQAQITGTTWEYVTKSGEQDRRFKDNRELPIMLYERVRLRSASGLNELLHISALGLGDKLRHVLGDLDFVPPTEGPLQPSAAEYSGRAQSVSLLTEEMTMEASKSIRGAFRQCIETANLSEPERWIGDLVVSDSFSRAEFDKLVAAKGLAILPEFRATLLDLVLLLANKCVEDHALSEAEIEELGFLVSVFQINDGEFVQARRNELQELLSTQLKRILEDRHVTEGEEILLRDLQKVFGVSYDQFVELLRQQAKTCIEDLENKREVILNRKELTLVEASIRNLRSIFLIPE